MTIFIDTTTLSDLSSYDGLTMVVERWLDRDDLTESVPDFIRLAEARFRRVLVMPDMETQVALVPAASVALPADYDSVRAFGINGYDGFDYLPPGAFYALPKQPDGSDMLGQPTKYTIYADTFVMWPSPDQTYSAQLSYRANLPSLSISNQSNWLLAKHPDAYLFQILLQAEFYGWNDERLPEIKGAVDEILGEIMISGVRHRYGSGPLTMKPAVNERGGLRR